MSEQMGDENVVIDNEETTRKLFVGGLSWQTTEDGLQRYFESLGMPVDRVMIMRDKLTGRSRGFGFVILVNIDHLDKAVNTALQLDGRKIEAKRAIPKREMEKSSRKLFVGGIPVSLSTTDFKKYFESFGTVTESQVVTERESGRSRGFGFVTFQDDESVEKVMATQHTIQGKPVEIKRAEPKKVERAKPIIVPVQVPYFAPAYPFPMTYPAQYMQGFTFDPSSSTFVLAQQPGTVFSPQFLDPSGVFAVSDQQYLAQSYYDQPPSPTSSGVSPSDPRARKSGVVTSASPNTPKRFLDVHNDNDEDTWAIPMENLSLAERVRVAQNEVKEMRTKRRGMTAPEPERPRRGSAYASTTHVVPQPVVSGRKSGVTGAAWRSRGSNVVPSKSPSTPPAPKPTSPTTSPNTTAKEGGTLHKYFQ